MTMYSQSSDLTPEEGFSLLDLLLVLSQHLRIIISITILATLVSTAIVMTIPTVYTSNTKLIELEYIGKINFIHAANSDRQLLANNEERWKPVDVSVLKGILESNHLKELVANKLGYNQYTLQVKQDKQTGVLTIIVEGKNRDVTTKIVAATVEEAGRMAFRMGILASPSLALESKHENQNGANILVRQIDFPTLSTKTRPNHAIIICLSTIFGLFFSIFWVLFLDGYKNLSNEDKQKICKIKTALKLKTNQSSANNLDQEIK